MEKQEGKKIWVVLVVLAIVALTISFFMRGNSNSNSGSTESIVIGVPNWNSGTGTAYVLQEMIKKNFDMEVQLQPGTNEVLYAGIADGTIHIHPEGWTPNQNNWHTQFADVLRRNDNGVYVVQGLCVDRSLAEQYNIIHVNDLLNPEITQYFDSDGDGRGEVWVGDEGWGSTAVERIRAKSYGYDALFELLEMNESEALQRLTKATDDGKMFAIYCYTPHSMWRTHNLYQLEEPAHDSTKWKVVFPSEDPQWLEKSSAAVGWELAELHIYYAKSLEEQYPHIAEFLRGIQFTIDELLTITYESETSEQDPTIYAQQWVAENR